MDKMLRTHVEAWREKRRDWKLGQKMGIQETVSGERMCSLTQPFCQALTSKGSVPVPKQPEPHGCSVKGKRLKGKRLTGIFPG